MPVYTTTMRNTIVNVGVTQYVNTRIMRKIAKHSVLIKLPPQVG